MTKKSWVFAIAIVLLLEVILRAFGSHFSSNVAQISAIKHSIADLGSTTEGQSVLFIGSSLVADGVDTSQLIELVHPETQAEKVAPDASNIWDWYCILKDATEDDRPFPTTVVIGYAWDQLTDQAELNINKTFGFFCRNSELTELRRYANFDVEGVFKATASQVSMIYILRSAIRNNLLNRVIRNYQQTTQDLNRANYQKVQGGPDEHHRREFTYGALNLVAGNLKMRGTNLIILAMPTRGDYSFDTRLCRVAQELNILVIDGRNIVELDLSDFRDPIHLNQTGKSKFTRALATEVTDALIGSNNTTGCVANIPNPKRLP